MSLHELFPKSPVLQQIAISCLEIVRPAIGGLTHPGAVKWPVVERHPIDAQIQASLPQTEVMLKEMHAQVNNNLQIVSSLLKLQAGYIKDQEVLNRCRASQNRVRAMALVHKNGIDWPEGFGVCQTSSLGLQLVYSLVVQVQGALNLDRTQRPTFTITFNELTSKEGL